MGFDAEDYCQCRAVHCRHCSAWTCRVYVVECESGAKSYQSLPLPVRSYVHVHYPPVSCSFEQTASTVTEVERTVVVDEEVTASESEGNEDEGDGNGNVSPNNTVCEAVCE